MLLWMVRGDCRVVVVGGGGAILKGGGVTTAIVILLDRIRRCVVGIEMTVLGGSGIIVLVIIIIIGRIILLLLQEQDAQRRCQLLQGLTFRFRHLYGLYRPLKVAEDAHKIMIIIINNNIILIIVIMVVAVTMVRILMTDMNLILSTTCIPPPPFSSSSLSLVPLQLMDEIGQDPLQGTKGILMMGMMMINRGLVIVKGSETTTTTSAVTATTFTAGSISTGSLLQIGQGMLNQGTFPTSRWSRHHEKWSLLSWWVTTTSTATTNSISTMDVTVPTAVTNCSNNVDANPLQFVCSDPLNHVRHGPYRPLPQW